MYHHEIGGFFYATNPMRKDIYDYLKFRLDSQYEDYEFELIPIPPYDFLENNLTLEPYEYFGSDDIVFGIRAKQIILYYNADILTKVKIKFRDDKVEILKNKIEKLQSNLPTNMNLRLFFDTFENSTWIEYEKKVQ